MAVTMQIQGLKEFMDDLGATPKLITSVVGKAMEEATKRIKNAVQDKLDNEKITNKGDLKRSVQAEWSSSQGKVYVGLKRGIYIERGTGPYAGHSPYFIGKRGREALEDWARLKLGKSGMGFVLARSIGRKGIRPHPFFFPTVEESMDTVGKIFAKIPEAIVRTLAGKPI